MSQTNMSKQIFMETDQQFDMQMTVTLFGRLFYLLEWAIALHGRVLVPCLQMNSTYHDSNLMINLPIWELISCLLFKYFLRVKSLLYLIVLSQ